MKLSDFSYSLPERLIAQRPLPRRDQSRLLVVNRTAGSIRHEKFAAINDFLPEKSAIVFNDTKVIPARIFGVKERTGGKVEIFVLKPRAGGYEYEVLLKPGPRIKDGDKVVFPGSSVTAEVISKADRLVRFSCKDVMPFLKKHGHVPLPPYIHRPDNSGDRETYQTVYAKHPGSVAAPTAGLHFTKRLLAQLKRNGHSLETVTLHVNLATFKPVVAEDIRNHDMHTEEYAVAPAAWQRILQAKRNGRKIVAVGTTSCRVLESAAASGRLSGETKLFVYPGYDFKMVDALVTNFHLPQSTLLMLVYAFGGIELMRRVYQEAIEKEYRFFSYGDGMVIL